MIKTQSSSGVFDPRGVTLRPVVIHDETVSQVSLCKYLGVLNVSLVTWSTHVDSVCTRLQWLHFMQRLLVLVADEKWIVVFFIRWS